MILSSIITGVICFILGIVATRSYKQGHITSLISINRDLIQRIEQLDNSLEIRITMIHKLRNQMLAQEEAIQEAIKGIRDYKEAQSAALVTFYRKLVLQKELTSNAEERVVEWKRKYYDEIQTNLG